MKKPVLQDPEKKCRGRPCSFDREDLVERVMDLFWEQGFSALSLNEIAQKTGLTRASLYNAFGDKETLFLEAFEHYLANSPYRKLKNLKSGDAVSPLLFSVADEICAHYADDDKKKGCLTIRSLNELSMQDAKLRKKIEEAYENIGKMFKNLVKIAIENKELPPNTDINTTANIMVVFMSGFGIFAQNISKEKKLKEIYHNFLLGLGFIK